MMLKSGISVLEKKGLNYLIGKDNKIIKYKPWLGESLSFLYDYIMKASVFPKKFGADINKHFQILAEILENVKEKRVLELGTGSGSATQFLDPGNIYTGTDISAGLLKQAVRRFKNSGFKDPKFYVTSADNTPFANGTFHLCLCILSLNFFDDISKVFKEVERILMAGGSFVCAVPVPERNSLNSVIHGTQKSESELNKICADNGLVFKPIVARNGSLLYFKAFKPI
jgi:SAM-dependent methyltransferase